MCFIHCKNNIWTIKIPEFHSVCVVSKLRCIRCFILIGWLNGNSADFCNVNKKECTISVVTSPVCSSDVFVAMWQHLPDTRCEWGSPHGDTKEGWPGTAALYGNGRPQWVNNIFKVSRHVGFMAGSAVSMPPPVSLTYWVSRGQPSCSSGMGGDFFPLRFLNH